MIRTQISLDEKTYRRAQATARKAGISFAELVRRLLGKALAPEKEPPSKPWTRWTGSVKGGGPRDSDSDAIDRVVYGQDR